MATEKNNDWLLRRTVVQSVAHFVLTCVPSVVLIAGTHAALLNMACHGMADSQQVHIK